ncbi:hypothetical protein [Paenibacillus terrigena]|uniref:hypothetical protein n=1 Tax=Paenibacillus terrigena TaxID=369333 RepID=UPI00036CCD79|nr:hypothetical protein [Paenibacillus terrigena]
MLFKRSNKSETLSIGGRPVHIRKVTIAQWRELFDSIQAIPQLIISVMAAPASERAGFFVLALRESFDDIVRVTSVLTGLDEEFIDENASIDELVAYYTAMAKANNFGELLKNAQSVLGTLIPQVVRTQDAT